MPEGHKTHRIAKDQGKALVGQVLRITSPQGRFRQEARKVSGQKLDAIEAFGKRLFYRFENGRIIHVHLGRYGSYQSLPVPPPKPVGQVRMRIVGQADTIDLRGPTTCKVISDQEMNDLIDQLGPDPLRDDSRSAKKAVWSVVRESRKPIGGLLLDQAIVAGIGNIFRAEMLFESRIDPRRLGCELTEKEFSRLWKAVLRQMRLGFKLGKIVTVRAKDAGKPLADLDGKERFYLYGQEYCPECAASLSTPLIASRKIYFCHQCQS